jgi:2-desacetyl-2-hydroxyethyl bacteriochlorophyllide A dehydrogenase
VVIAKNFTVQRRIKLMESIRIVWLDKEQVSIEKYQVESPGKDEVLIRSLVSLISPGTERAFFKALPDTPQNFPMYPGYSNVGEIMECGDNTIDIKPGDLVFSEGPHCSHLIQNFRTVIKIPQGVDPIAASYCEIATVALQGIRKTKLEIGENVIILGMGIVGLFALQFAYLSGAKDVFAFDLQKDRLSIASIFGASKTFTNVKECIEQLTIKPSIVIDATGDPDVIPIAFELCKERGCIEILGGPRGVTKQIDFYKTVHKQGLQVIGAHNSIRPTRLYSSHGFWTLQDDQSVVMNFLQKKRLQTEQIPIKKYNAKNAKNAYNDLLYNKCVMAYIFDWS